MKKFLLFNSPIFENGTDENETFLPPLGLGYIATSLKSVGFDVRLIDCVQNNFSVSKTIEIINQEKPDYVGINIFTQNFELVKHICESIKITTEIFIGGQVVKFIYNDILQWKTDNKLNIVIGEGEFIIPSIALNTFEEKIYAIYGSKFVYKVDNYSKYFPLNISELPLDRTFFKNNVLINHYGENESAIITSRGCIYNCAFCGGARSLNRDTSVRIRTKESVIKEIQQIVYEEPSVKSIRILDDLFIRDTASIESACYIFNKFPNINWRGMAHVLSLLNSIDKVKELKTSGCREVFMGIESGSEKIRKKINKNGNICDIIKVAEEILSSGIDLKGYFILGFPSETKDDFQKTYDLAYSLMDLSKKYSGNFRTSVFQFRPYHGTQLYKELLEKLGHISMCHYNDAIGVIGRTQFNFESGNYSEEPQDILYDFINKIQKLAR